MARTVPAAHTVRGAAEFTPDQPIYTTPLESLALTPNALFCRWTPCVSVQCMDDSNLTYAAESGTAAFVEHYVVRFPVQAGRTDIKVRVRLRSAAEPTSAAAVCQIRTTSGTTNVSLPAAATATDWVWYEASGLAYSTASDTDFVSVALKADVNSCGDVYLSHFEVWYQRRSSLTAGVVAGTFRAADTIAWAADEPLSVKRARDVDDALEHVHKAMLWPYGAVCGDLTALKGTIASGSTAAWSRVLGPIFVPVLGGSEVTRIGFAALAVGPALNSCRIFSTYSNDDIGGDPPMIDSHTWQPALTGYSGTEWRAESNWEIDTLTVPADRPCFIWLDLRNDGGIALTYLHSLYLWAVART